MSAAALYLVLVAEGVIGGTWGPLPYGVEECETRRAEFQAQLSAHPETAGYVLSCEFWDVRPELGGTPRAALEAERQTP